MHQYSTTSVSYNGLQGNLRQDMRTLGLNNVHIYDIMHSAYCKDQQCQKQCVSNVDRIGSGTNFELCKNQKGSDFHSVHLLWIREGGRSLC